MEQTLTLNVITRLQDNGDGGYTMYVYNNEDELIADHPKSEDFVKNAETGEWGYVKVELSQEERDEILNEENPYDNGYIERDTITVKIVDGVASLAKPLSFHAGQ